MKNHFTESEETTFFSSRPLSSFQIITSQNQQRITSLWKNRLTAGEWFCSRIRSMERSQTHPYKLFAHLLRPGHDMGTGLTFAFSLKYICNDIYDWQRCWLTISCQLVDHDNKKRKKSVHSKWCPKALITAINYFYLGQNILCREASSMRNCSLSVANTTKQNSNL
jgi:hypothetical protein